ncbi:MAG: endoplasmic oxidoreductin-1 [Heterodermia speciosa]|uniref:Endoplasmic oxidoreductin-1 n=1 Tax=Heterodermia speciosa TaxID=116794 RepID=A0A8H3G0W0_9LECA|nr:MAG: endoplasmic oxidoreductin-1 [Heterodermia speciosa]
MRSTVRTFYLAFFALWGKTSSNAAGSASSEVCAVGSASHLLSHINNIYHQIDPRAIVSDACVSYSTLDGLNNALSPSLNSITQHTDFFAFYRLNLYDQVCPVRAWDDETGTCGNIACKVDTLEDEKDIPLIWRAEELSKLEGPKAAHPGRELQKERGAQKPLQGTLGENVGESCVVEYDDECDERDYCIPEDESATAKGDYVSLVDNPERFTGYAGSDVWDAIYRENCFSKEDSTTPPSNPMGLFQAKNDLRNIIQANSPSPNSLTLDDSCLEKRVFYRIISGMHASISTHICSDYLNQTTGTWGPNLQCYLDRLATHPERISNLYFNYALLLRATAKLRTYLRGYTFCSGDPDQDASTKTKILALADAASARPRIFDESVMFQGPEGGLKEDFRNRFRNVSRLMDCVGCDKCRLWGKLQTVGYGTALKVLFEFDEDKNGENPLLKRTELVALVNTLHRVSNSLASLGRLRALTQQASPSPPSTPAHADARITSTPPTTTNQDLDDDDDDDEDFEPFPSSSSFPSNSNSTPLSDTVYSELQIVWRAYLYVLRSWITFPAKLFRILLVETSRLWSFWLGLEVQERSWDWRFPRREEL